MADHAYVQTIKKYYQGCNTGDIKLMKSTFTDDVVHYFTHHEPISGADALAAYWQKMQPRINAKWYCDHAIVEDNECVIEWTMAWDAPSGNRERMRGAEWYEFVGGRISEIRAYYVNRHLPYKREHFELDGFPYESRNYVMNG